MAPSDSCKNFVKVFVRDEEKGKKKEERGRVHRVFDVSFLSLYTFSLSPSIHVKGKRNHIHHPVASSSYYLKRERGKIFTVKVNVFHKERERERGKIFTESQCLSQREKRKKFKRSSSLCNSHDKKLSQNKHLHPVMNLFLSSLVSPSSSLFHLNEVSFIL